jgi:hypothetical protein
MSIHALKPLTELAKVHADVESGSLAEAVFAIDLGAVATGDPTTPPPMSKGLVKVCRPRPCRLSSAPSSAVFCGARVC